ncbi:MAG: hypothetical protein PHH01_00320 [Patescibacteria group bacterium]|nr:hypothetical protein [Patescibacteria group bacterium]
MKSLVILVVATLAFCQAYAGAETVTIELTASQLDSINVPVDDWAQACVSFTFEGCQYELHDLFFEAVHIVRLGTDPSVDMKKLAADPTFHITFMGLVVWVHDNWGSDINKIAGPVMTDLEAYAVLGFKPRPSREAAENFRNSIRKLEKVSPRLTIELWYRQ